MNLRIQEVTADNWQTVALLSVEKNQQAFIESNAYSLLQSQFEPQWKSVALMDGEQIVGYAMYGMDLSSRHVWLDRFMIDQKYQGQGYAKRFLPLLMKQIQEEYQNKVLYLSIAQDNVIAQRLYESFGFRFNGQIDDESHLGSALVMYRELH